MGYWAVGNEGLDPQVDGLWVENVDYELVGGQVNYRKALDGWREGGVRLMLGCLARGGRWAMCGGRFGCVGGVEGG